MSRGTPRRVQNEQSLQSLCSPFAEEVKLGPGAVLCSENTSFPVMLALVAKKPFEVKIGNQALGLRSRVTDDSLRCECGGGSGAQ